MCSEKSQWPTKSCFGQILKTLNSSRHRVKDFCIYHHTMADASMANVHRETHRTIDPWCLRGCKYPFSIPKEWQQVVQHSSTEAVKTTFYILNSLVVWNMNGLFFHHIGNVIIPTDFNIQVFISLHQQSYDRDNLLITDSPESQEFAQNNPRNLQSRVTRSLLYRPVKSPTVPGR